DSLCSGTTNSWFGRGSMKLLRRQFRHLAGAAIAIILVMLGGHAAWSQPTRTIRFVVPYSPGGAVDFLARLLADHMGRMPGQLIVVENRAGASAIIGAEIVAHAPPDGNTLLINSQDLVITPHVRKLSYDPLASFEPICHLTSSQTVIIVNGAS